MASTVILDYGLNIGAVPEPVATTDQLTMSDSIAMGLLTDAFAVVDLLHLADSVGILLAVMTGMNDQMAIAESLSFLLQVEALQFSEVLLLSEVFNGVLTVERIAFSDVLAYQDSVNGIILSNGISALFGEANSFNDALSFLLHVEALQFGDALVLSELVNRVLTVERIRFSDTLSFVDTQLHVTGQQRVSILDASPTSFSDAAVVRAITPLSETASDSDAAWNDASVTIVGVKIVTDSLPGAAVGQDYSVQLEAEGGILPYTWSVISGSLPDGLTLTSDGLISGTPTTEGESDFTVQVQDSNGQMMLMRIRLVK